MVQNTIIIAFLSHMLPITMYRQIEGAMSSSFVLHAFSGD